MAAIKFPTPRVPNIFVRSIGTWILVIVAAILLWTAFYTVPAESEGVVLRFGRFSHVVPPGLHFRLPLGIDVTRVVPVKRQLKHGPVDPIVEVQHLGAGSHALLDREIEPVIALCEPLPRGGQIGDHVPDAGPVAQADGREAQRTQVEWDGTR